MKLRYLLTVGLLTLLGSGSAHAVMIEFSAFTGKSDTDIVQWDFVVEQVSNGWKFSVARPNNSSRDNCDGTAPDDCGDDILLIGFQNELGLIGSSNFVDFIINGSSGSASQICVGAGLTSCGSGGGNFNGTGQTFNHMVRVGAQGSNPGDFVGSAMFTVLTQAALSCEAISRVGIRAQTTPGDEGSAKNWSTTCSTSVPEPTALLLFGVGLLGAGLTRRWRTTV